jgi:uncharacterized repeat protein (TIGR04052 family)
MICYILKKIISCTIILWFCVSLLSGCSQPTLPTKILFQVVYENNLLSCTSNFNYASNTKMKKTEPKKWQYQQLQFFIYGVEVNTKENGWQPWLMTTNSHQANNVALLGEVCNEKNEQGYWQLELMPLDDTVVISDIRFTVGVPFELNHLNPLTQPSPLNDASMFWGWQGGHKFMRVELVSSNDDWLFHLGSKGCNALSAVRAPKIECLHPNRVPISLPFSEQTSVIEFDLAVLIHNIELTRKNSCQSSADEENCKVLFNNLGLESNSRNESLLFRAKKNG